MTKNELVPGKAYRWVAPTPPHGSLMLWKKPMFSEDLGKIVENAYDIHIRHGGKLIFHEILTEDISCSLSVTFNGVDGFITDTGSVFFGSELNFEEA
jgi:hypothetical protein